MKGGSGGRGDVGVTEDTHEVPEDEPCLLAIPVMRTYVSAMKLQTITSL